MSTSFCLEVLWLPLIGSVLHFTVFHFFVMHYTYPIVKDEIAGDFMQLQKEVYTFENIHPLSSASVSGILI